MSDPLDSRPLAYSYIRMSTDMQLKGNSRQRQLERSARYAKDHGLNLADTLQLEDIGISAFKGANLKQGALGQFLDAARNGRIPRGSYLIVESLDRLSRQQIVPSLSLFLEIIKAGINLVTLQDNRVFQAEHTAFEDLMISLITMSRAHEESLVKSQRVSAAWDNKRRLANEQTRPLTRLCPAWLRLSDNRSQYEELSDRVAVIRSIFRDTVAGIGGYVITKRLNERGVRSFGRSKGWQRSYVFKILNNRAVIGEYQPCTLVDGRRKPIGNAIKDYFPRIIDDELFYRAQQSRSERRISGRGRKGQYVTNLFSGLASCAYCHSRMTFENKGAKPKGGTFLVCEASKRGLGCVTTGWRYDEFEKSFLGFVEQLDLPRLIKDDDSEKKSLDGAIQALEGKRISLRQEMENVYNLSKIDPKLEFVVSKLRSLQDQLNEIEQQITQKTAERKSLEATEIAFYESKEEIKSLIARLQTPSDNDLYKLRSQVAARIKALVETLLVAPVGRAPLVAKAVEFVATAEDDEKDKAAIIDALKRNEDHRYFAVGFKNGNVLGVYPSKDDPLKFDTKVVATSPGKADGELISYNSVDSGVDEMRLVSSSALPADSADDVPD